MDDLIFWLLALPVILGIIIYFAAYGILYIYYAGLDKILEKKRELMEEDKRMQAFRDKRFDEAIVRFAKLMQNEEVLNFITKFVVAVKTGVFQNDNSE